MLREERHTSRCVRVFPIRAQIRTTASGVTQRDTNFYDFMIDLEMQESVRDSLILPHWSFPQKDYVFDLLLTRDLSGGHIRSLFTYEELHKVLSKAIRDASARWTSLPELPHKMPAYQHNRASIEALTLSGGRNIMEFGEIWREEVTRAVREDDG
ncbi:hypothetical protein F5141DRAFT_1144555 [Pisolithus sp. B1]|nr:hypothetical protein F5141DRAFT_1144555 [Pisolithus sp. B1]